MGMLHVLPSHSAGGAMQRALCNLNRDDADLVFPDDLSCGPIDSDEPQHEWNGGRVSAKPPIWNPR
jgi:hypothetical protein